MQVLTSSSLEFEIIQRLENFFPQKCVREDYVTLSQETLESYCNSFQASLSLWRARVTDSFLSVIELFAKKYVDKRDKKIMFNSVRYGLLNRLASFYKLIGCSKNSFC